MINKINNFVTNANDFEFIEVRSNKDFSFTFIFQPIQVLAKKFLEN